ncbi:kinase-like domain-containing protein [Xylaria bambusicola]|uniref:kinase-like domain-containing protein n=1 Tax=Xylaria bambusicola TaxID=326684 RepID=UPI0020074F37|nr:kinase-like domain-containing protein [Xylaria bambusicola]KAI0503089.1 kinase-like domain-containing protein [Xylaria bambusicola]
MSNPNSIAWVVPLDGKYLHKVEDKIKHSRLRKAPTAKPETPKSLNGRETPPPKEFDPNSVWSLELNIGYVPKSSVGVVFGTDNETCDVILPQVEGISRRHFALTYKRTIPDNHYRLVLRDLGSRGGTAVAYDRQGDSHKRSAFDWILDGFLPPDSTRELKVRLLDDFQFQIFVNHDHDFTSAAYVAHVNQFLHGTTDVANLLQHSMLDRGDETQAVTPGEGEIILFAGFLGEGGFGSVTRHWNVSTGEEYACKQPTTRKYDIHAWNHEIAIMKQPNIVQFCFHELNPLPKIYLEYMPLGDLLTVHERDALTHHECLEVLSQCASALGYFHREFQASHRDIKPENILVQRRGPSHNPRDILVKLGDFGISKVGDVPRSYCGTTFYMAPEVMSNAASYTSVADIWSLGVVILQLAYGLPMWTGDGRTYATYIISHLMSLRDPKSPIIGILKHMLVANPNSRWSAEQCYSHLQASRVDSSSNQNLPLYRILQIGQIKIGYRQAHVFKDGRVVEEGLNATHLFDLRSTAYCRTSMQFFLRNRVAKDDRDMCREGAGLRGSYLNLSDALRFCNKFKITEGIKVILLLRPELGEWVEEAEPPAEPVVAQDPDGGENLDDADAKSDTAEGAEDADFDPGENIEQPAPLPQPGGTAEERVSYYTQPSYSNGLFLALPNQSYKQLLE